MSKLLMNKKQVRNLRLTLSPLMKFKSLKINQRPSPARTVKVKVTLPPSRSPQGLTTRGQMSPVSFARLRFDLTPTPAKLKKLRMAQLNRSRRRLNRSLRVPPTTTATFKL